MYECMCQFIKEREDLKFWELVREGERARKGESARE